MSLPNVITCFRLFLVPMFIFVYFSSLEANFVIAIMIFIIAGITDVLDGYIARKYNKITKIGQVLDPLADKLMQITVLSCFTISRFIPIWIIMIYGLKELLMIIGGIYLFFKKEKLVIPANRYGKLATILFYLAVLLVFLPNSQYFFYVTMMFSILAFVQYSLIAIKKLKIMNSESKLIDLKDEIR
ncbi:MAG: CDP-diacylglycerol--glycerol-3-phosphate 3-phosphatidyltransferase [Haloplasmataceae bacterium]|nr:CDP-diacylglycerol--glycerol-3-phosphate 3-phosphatidyltransferase [Haloplasmataceae bacterium]